MRRAFTFAEYASSPSLTPDGIYTVELLMDHVKYKLGEAYYSAWMERDAARRQPDYTPSFPLELVAPAAQVLKAVTSLFLQTGWGDVRPIRDITALGCLPNLRFISLSGHEIADISPLRHCVNLERLELPIYPVRDLSPLRECRRLKSLKFFGDVFPDLSALAGCLDLEELEIGGRIDDLSVLESFPKLRRLRLDDESLAAFRRLTELPAVRELDFACSEPFDSFVDLPAMPALLVINSASVRDLQGIQKFPSLRNLTYLCGTFSSLEPIWCLRHLTHLHIYESGLRTLETVPRIYALRKFEFSSDVPDLSLEPLKKLPALHTVQLWLPEEYSGAIAELKEELSSWDTEFLSSQPRHTPSLEIHILPRRAPDEEETVLNAGLTEADDNPEMLVSEMNWLRGKLDEMLIGEFGEMGGNCDHGIGWTPSRTMPVGMDDDRLLECLPRLVLGMQRVLAHAVNDWNINLLSEAGDRNDFFTILIYPDKVAVDKEYADRIRRLLSPR